MLAREYEGFARWYTHAVVVILVHMRHDPVFGRFLLIFLLRHVCEATSLLEAGGR